MAILALHPSRPWSHLKISPGAWFFMNHYASQPDSTAHDHNYLELAFVMGGRARHYSVRGETAARPGDIYIIPVGAWHGYARCERLNIYNCLLSPELLNGELAWMARDEVFGGLLGSHAEPGGPIRKLRAAPAQMKRLRGQLESLLEAHRVRASRARVLGHLLLLLDLLRACQRSESRPQPLSSVHPAVEHARRELHADLGRDWTLPALASLLKLNPSYLVRLFRAETGRSPMKYLADLRAEQAAGLLLSTRLRIGEIGLRVGWPEPKQFARAFQRQFGISASAYRRRMAKAFAT